MKKFELVVEMSDNTLSMGGTNDGFTALELIALLDIKKLDIIEQFTKLENFTHRRVVKRNGEWVSIEKEEET